MSTSSSSVTPSAPPPAPAAASSAPPSFVPGAAGAAATREGATWLGLSSPPPGAAAAAVAAAAAGRAAGLSVCVVTGGSGLVGSAIAALLESPAGAADAAAAREAWVFLSSAAADLRDAPATLALFSALRPALVVHAAARVGGLYDNLAHGTAMLVDNSRMAFSVFAAARAVGARKVLTLLSTCIFPDPPPALPLTEAMLHAGPPHASNAPYAHAKRLAAVLGAAHEAEAPPELGGTRFVCVTPTNVYGPRDNFSVAAGHVLPALVAKAAAAADAGAALLVLGSGAPLRQFVFAPDLAQLIVWAAREYDDAAPLILAPEEEVSIAHAARLVAAATPGLGADRVAFDPTRADGQVRKTASNALLRSRRPDFVFTPLAEGVKATVDWFAEHKKDAGTRT